MKGGQRTSSRPVDLLLQIRLPNAVTKFQSLFQVAEFCCIIQIKRAHTLHTFKRLQLHRKLPIRRCDCTQSRRLQKARTREPRCFKSWQEAALLKPKISEYFSLSSLLLTLPTLWPFTWPRVRSGDGRLLAL